MNVRGRLTRWYAKLRLGSDVEKSGYSVRGVDTDVYWIQSDSHLKGQCTMFQTLLLNDSKLPDDVLARDYVVLHEIGHKRSPRWMYILSWFVRTPLLILTFIAFPLAIGRILGVVITGVAWSVLITFILAQALLIAILIIPFVALSWLDEGYAEVFTLRKLGREEFDQARRTLEDPRDRSLFWKVFRPLMYPPERVIYRFRRK